MRMLLKCLIGFLVRTDTPLWVTFVGFIAGAISVYYVTPLLNQKLETQKIKTEYVVRSLDNINNKTQEMLSELSIVNRKLISQESNYGENLDKSVRLATELQWKAIEISAVLEDEESLSVIDKFQASLSDVRDKISKIKSPESSLEALAEIRKFVPKSLALTNRIASLSGIKFRP